MNDLVDQQRARTKAQGLPVLAGGQGPRHWRQRLERATAWLGDLQRASAWIDALSGMRLGLSDYSLWGEALAALVAEDIRARAAADRVTMGRSGGSEAGERTDLASRELAASPVHRHRQGSTLAESPAVSAGVAAEKPDGIWHRVASRAPSPVIQTEPPPRRLSPRAERALLTKLAERTIASGGSSHHGTSLVRPAGPSSSPAWLLALRGATWQGEHSTPERSPSGLAQFISSPQEGLARAWQRQVFEDVCARLHGTDSRNTARQLGYDERQRTFRSFGAAPEISTGLDEMSVANPATDMDPLSQQWWTPVAASPGLVDLPSSDWLDAHLESNSDEGWLIEPQQKPTTPPVDETEPLNGPSRPRSTQGTARQRPGHDRTPHHSVAQAAATVVGSLVDQPLAKQWSTSLAGPEAPGALLFRLAERSQLAAQLPQPRHASSASNQGDSLDDTTRLALSQEPLPETTIHTPDAPRGQPKSTGWRPSPAETMVEAGSSRHALAEWTQERSLLGFPSQAGDILAILREASPKLPGHETPTAQATPLPSLESPQAPGALSVSGAARTALQWTQNESGSTEEDLSALAAKIKRILDDEARRYGMDV